MSALRRVAGVLGSTAIVLAIALGLLELLGRLVDPLGISYYPETARYLDTLVIEEPIGYRNRPGLSGRFHGAPVSINALGLRDREVAAKAPGEKRLIVLGDSVPFGIGVAFEDSLPYQIERYLADRRPGRSIRTLNFGVPSYNTEQQLVQLRTLGLPLEPDAVMLIFVANDIEPRLWVLEKRGAWYANWAQRSYAACLLYVLPRRVRERVADFVLPPAHAAGSGAPVGLGGYRADHPRWQAVERSLSEMQALLHSRGVPFVVFTIDEPPVVLDLLRSVAAREGFPLVNVVRRLDPRWAGMDESLFHNSPSDSHPSALGNRALATLIGEELERIGVLDGPGSP